MLGEALNRTRFRVPFHQTLRLRRSMKATTLNSSYMFRRMINPVHIAMESGRGLQASRRLLLALSPPRRQSPHLSTLPKAYAHRQLSISSSQHATADPTKPIVLEKPDKFRPPSHPQRLSKRAPRNYPGPALSEPEREAQKKRRYPHTFPNPGTRLHWFLTTGWIHLCISIVCLYAPEH